MKSRIALVVAILLGAVATLGVYAVIEGYRKESQKTMSQERVVYALRDIKAGEVLTAEIVRAEPIPAAYVSKDHILEKDVQVYYQNKVYNRVTADSPLMRSYFQPDVEDISATKPLPGFRAVSVPVKYHQGVSGLLRPGQRVDVLAGFKVKFQGGVRTDARGQPVIPTDEEIDAEWKAFAQNLGGLKLPPTSQGEKLEEWSEGMKDLYSTIQLRGAKGELDMTLTVLQNIPIIATDSDPQEGKSFYESVTLEVTSEQAQILVFSQQNGTIHLSLRGKSDVDPARLVPMYTDRLLDARRVSAPHTVRSSEDSPNQ